MRWGGSSPAAARLPHAPRVVRVAAHQRRPTGRPRGQMMFRGCGTASSRSSLMTLAPNSLQARDVAYTVHPYTNLRQHERQGPLVITGGEGVFVQDDDGKRYLEGLAGLWCTGLGFNEK